MGLITEDKHHRVHDSASTELTVTGQVKGDGEFWPPTESKPLGWLKQNLAQLITTVRVSPKPNLAQIHALGAFWANWWNTTFLCLLVYAEAFKPIL